MMWDRFKADTSGTMATIFAIGSTVLLIAAGAALEVHGLTKAANKLQGAADSAVLAAALSGEEDIEKLQLVATDSAVENYDSDFELEVKNLGGALKVEVSADYEMIFMSMFGYETRTLNVEAGAVNGTGGKLNIALALDTTLSMEGERIVKMITAASDLVDMVEEADKGLGNAKVAVIPFSDYVRINMGYAGEDWIDVQPDREVTWETLNEENSVNCREEGTGESIKTVCDSYVYDTQVGVASWNGCMVSRADGLHKVASYGGDPFKGNAGHTACNRQNNIASPLSDDFDRLKADIAALTPRGKTYLPVGLLWAWRALEEEQLFTDDTIEEDALTQRVLLLMTDGSNTASLNDESIYDDWDGIFHWGSSDEEYNREKADELTIELCASIKNADIRLVTVAYEVDDDDDTKNMLNACASSGANYYDVDASTLGQAFDKIGSGFSNARLTL